MADKLEAKKNAQTGALLCDAFAKMNEPTSVSEQRARSGGKKRRKFGNRLGSLKDDCSAASRRRNLVKITSKTASFTMHRGFFVRRAVIVR